MGAIEKRLVDIFLPQIAGLHHVHVGIHRFETVFHDLLLDLILAQFIE